MKRVPRVDKPRKKWEPDYRFGGNPASFFMPPPLGRSDGYPRSRRKGKRA